jgi:CheY-like chemotaxis protein
MAATRVLLVEDEFLVRSVAADELGDQSYEVVEAETGDRAAQLLEREPFDVLLTDVRMPGKTRRHRPSPPCQERPSEASGSGRVRLRRADQHASSKRGGPDGVRG